MASVKGRFPYSCSIFITPERRSERNSETTHQQRVLVGRANEVHGVSPLFHKSCEVVPLFHHNQLILQYLFRINSKKALSQLDRIRYNGQVTLNVIDRFFWDSDPSALDLRKHSSYIIERLLERGDIPAVRWMLAHYPKNSIVDVLKQSRSISDKSRVFWTLFFHSQ